MNRKYQSSQAWEADELAGASITMQTPTRQPGIAADCIVPLFQAIVTGALVAGVITFVLGQSDYAGKLSPVFFGVWLSVAALAWLFLLADTRRLLRVIEELTGLDIDGDGQVGKPTESIVTVNAPAARKEAARIAEETERAEVASELAEFVAKLPVHGTDSRTWEPRIGRERYTAFRGVLIEMGWAAWNSHDKRQGWRLVLPVRAILQRISADEA